MSKETKQSRELNRQEPKCYKRRLQTDKTLRYRSKKD